MPPSDRVPQRYPFRLVEKAELIGDRTVGVVLASANGSTVPPGPWPITLVAEALAQAILAVTPPPHDAAPALVALDEVRLVQPVSPGARLEVHVEEVAAFPPLRRFSCRAVQAGALSASAEVTVAETRGGRA